MLGGMNGTMPWTGATPIPVPIPIPIPAALYAALWLCHVDGTDGTASPAMAAGMCTGWPVRLDLMLKRGGQRSTAQRRTQYRTAKDAAG
jgi:hypothetical protein